MALDGSPTDLIKSGKSATDIANLLSEGLREGEIYPPEIIKPRFTCKCSMEKVTSALDPLDSMCLYQASLHPRENSPNCISVPHISST
jgi:redox-regulated HSP33 family molecular chaperone